METLDHSFNNTFNTNKMEDKLINEKESIAIITEMIARTKERYMLGDGNILLMWGYLTVSVSALVWILLALTHNPAVNWLWFLIWIIGGIATPVMAKKQKIQKGAKSYTDTVISRLWSVVGFSSIASVLICLGFLLAKGIDSWSMMFTLALIIVPFAEIANGILMKENSLIWGGAIGLLAGIFTMSCIASGIRLCATWFMPLFILAFACMMIVPGHIINRKAKNNP